LNMLFIDSLIGFAFCFLQLSHFLNITPLNNFQCIFARPIFWIKFSPRVYCEFRNSIMNFMSF
jgi:hypothetical protein